MSATGTTSKACGESILRFKSSIKRFSKIGMPRLVTLAATRQARAITTQHLETATMFLPEREVKTEYDMLNILTDSAKNIHPINRRQEAESNAFHVALSSGGFNGLVTSDNLAKINHDRSYN